MTVWQATGVVAHVVLGVTWVLLLRRTAPQLRKNVRCRATVLRVLGLQSLAVVIGAGAVGLIHYTDLDVWSRVLVAVISALALWGVRLAYRQIVEAPRHRASWMDSLRRRHTPYHVHTSHSAAHRRVSPS